MSYYINIECRYVTMDDDSITIEHTNEFGMVDEYHIPRTMISDDSLLEVNIFDDVMELEIDAVFAEEVGIRDGVI